MRELLVLLVLNVGFVSLRAQSASTFHIVDFGTLTIPNSLELQGGEYKKIVRKGMDGLADRLGFELNEDRVVFQQSGLNAFSQESFESYARVIVETEKGSYGEFGSLDEPYQMTQSEHRELSNYFQQHYTASLGQVGIRIVEWYGVHVVRVNGAIALKISYLRQLKSKPAVRVDTWVFENVDRVHTVTMSHRSRDGDYWRPQMREILNSLTFRQIH